MRIAKSTTYWQLTQTAPKRLLLIGECKWTQADYAGLLLAELKRKASLTPFTKGKRITFALFLCEHPLDNGDMNIVYLDEVVENIVLFLPLLIGQRHKVHIVRFVPLYFKVEPLDTVYVSDCYRTVMILRCI